MITKTLLTIFQMWPLALRAEREVLLTMTTEAAEIHRPSVADQK